MWTVSYSPQRAFWFLRGLYLLLGTDLCFDMIEHGGRYGVGGFNVAHFAWLDRLLPVPTPTLYVGLLIGSSVLALLLGLGPAPRWLRLLLACAYTLGWMLSIHDSYQHHYLLSWLLFWCVAIPDLTARAAASGEPVRGWGLPMSCLTCAIVYFFTGISKSEPDWRGGDVLRSITHSKAPGAADPGKFDAARDLLLQLGFDDAGVWQLFALATIALQWLVALGYVAAATRDAHASPLRLWASSLGLLAALSFHATAELFHVFEIGLFSYYMMFVGCVLLGPTWLWRLPTRALAQASERLDVWLSPSDRKGARRADLVRPLVSVVLLLAVGFVVPLPGAVAATCAVALVSLVCTYQTLREPRVSAVTLDRLALKNTIVAAASWIALTQSSVPFDYYRRTAGELYRMGQLEQALSLYQLAERYAPAGHSRRSRIRELERELKASEARPRAPFDQAPAKRRN